MQALKVNEVSALITGSQNGLLTGEGEKINSFAKEASLSLSLSPSGIVAKSLFLDRVTLSLYDFHSRTVWASLRYFFLLDHRGEKR